MQYLVHILFYFEGHLVSLAVNLTTGRSYGGWLLWLCSTLVGNWKWFADLFGGNLCLGVLIGFKGFCLVLVVL